MKLKYFWGFEQEFDQLRKYLDLTKSSIDENQRKFLDWVGETKKKLSDDEKEQFMMFYEDDYIEATQDFPRILYSSFIVTWYTFVEHQLAGMCRKANLQISISIDDNERYGDGINRAYRFLQKGLNYRIEEELWQELKRIGKVRNQIVHSNGKFNFADEIEERVSSTKVIVKTGKGEDVYLLIDSNFYKYLESHNIIELGDNFYINPNYKFCQHLIGFGKDMLDKIDIDLSLLAVEKFEKRIQDKGGRKPLPDDFFPNIDNQ